MVSRDRVVYLRSAMGFVDYDAMTLEQAHEHAKRWAAGRQERLQWLHDQLHVDAARDSLSMLWKAVVGWHLAGGAERSTAALPIWWVDNERHGGVLNDALVMTDALAFPIRDELLRRQSAFEEIVLEKPEFIHHHEAVLAVGPWTLSPISMAYGGMLDLRPEADQRQTGDSLADDYLERRVQRQVRKFGGRARELAGEPDQ